MTAINKNFLILEFLEDFDNYSFFDYQWFYCKANNIKN